MIKKLSMILLSALFFAACCPAYSFAGEMDVLVNKLVEKGILTPYEGQILKADAKAEAAKPKQIAVRS